MKKALFVGSFAPFTNGHLNICIESIAAFDRFVVGVGVNNAKQYYLTAEQRTELVRLALADFVSRYKYRWLNGRYFTPNQIKAAEKLIAKPDRVEVIPYEDFTDDLIVRTRADFLIRGRRIVGDDESEAQFTAIINELTATTQKYPCLVINIQVPDLEDTYVSSSNTNTLLYGDKYIAAKRFLPHSVHNEVMKIFLKKRFREIFALLAPDYVDKTDEVFEILVKSHSAGRFYHNLSHIAYGLNQRQILMKACPLDEIDAAIVDFAIFFHDFDFKSELFSAEKAASYVHCEKLRQKVYNAVIATDHKRKPENELEKIMADCDLAIFADHLNYWDYAQGVYQEYDANYSRKEYAKGRLAVLEKFINNLTYYYMPGCSKETALNNLRRERGIWLSFS